MPPPGRGAGCQPVLGELIFQVYSFGINSSGLRGMFLTQSSECSDCSTLRALTHPFLSLWVYFSPTLLEEEMGT